MYTFSGKLKTFSIALMILGALGMGYGFLTAPKTTAEVEEILAHEDSAHGESHEATASHEEASSESHSAEDEQNHLEHRILTLFLWNDISGIINMTHFLFRRYIFH